MSCVKSAEQQARRAVAAAGTPTETRAARVALVRQYFQNRWTHTARHFSTCACLPSCPCKGVKTADADAESGSESDGEPEEELVSSDALESESDEQPTTATQPPPVAKVNNAGMKEWIPCPTKLGSEDTYLAFDDP